MNAHDVFISYSSEDEKLALAACAALEETRVPCWIATRNLAPGIGYGGQIFHAIESARVFVLLLTAQSNLSPHVQREVEYAAHCRLKLLVFEAQQVAIEPDLNYFLHNMHRLGGVDPSSPEGAFPRLTAAAESLLATAGKGQPGRPSSHSHGHETKRGPVYGPYEVMRRPDGEESLFELGRGPTGTTFKALDVRSRRPVALKVLPQATLAGVPGASVRLAERLEKARLLRDSRLPSLLATGQTGTAEFQAWLYIEGESLQTLVEREGPLPPVRALRIGWQIARALEAVWSAGLMHGDLKPANVLLMPPPSTDEQHPASQRAKLKIKVVDVRLAEGLAPAAGPDDVGGSLSGRHTLTLDSPGFASPEKCAQNPLDIRSDIYALGALLWYLLAGAPPFEGSPLQIVLAHMGKPPPFDRLAVVPPDVKKLLGWMLEKDRARRPLDPPALLDAIAQTGRGLRETGAPPASLAVDARAGQTLAGQTFAGQTMVPLTENGVSPRASPDEGNDSIIFASLIPGGRAPETAAGAAETPSKPVEELDFGHYRVLRREDGSIWELGRGAMGITYKAVDVDLDAPVALKVVVAGLIAHNPTARARFVREARSAASLRHPNVATVYHLGIDNDKFFYAMEFIAGDTVEMRVKRRGPFDARLALEIAIQVSGALAAAHRQGLVHRDIKPANLMLVEDADQDLTVKLIDFGLARPEEDEADGNITRAGGGMIGTPLYASPEQFEENELDTRSDIYSLGMTLWYMLAGKPAFTGSLASIMMQHLTRAPAFDVLAAAGVPEELVEILRRMLAKAPADRPQTPAELRADLRRAREKLETRGSGPLPPPVPETVEVPAAVPAEAGAPGWRERCLRAIRSVFAG